jgi:hypothetical protein
MFSPALIRRLTSSLAFSLAPGEAVENVSMKMAARGSGSAAFQARHSAMNASVVAVGLLNRSTRAGSRMNGTSSPWQWWCWR